MPYSVGDRIDGEQSDISGVVVATDTDTYTIRWDLGNDSYLEMTYYNYVIWGE